MWGSSAGVMALPSIPATSWHIWPKFINQPPPTVQSNICTKLTRFGCSNSKRHVLLWRPMQPRVDVNTQAAVIGHDVWLTGTVSHHHNYDRALSYSYFKACIPGFLRGGYTRPTGHVVMLDIIMSQTYIYIFFKISLGSINKDFKICPESNSSPPAVCQTCLIWTMVTRALRASSLRANQSHHGNVSGHLAGAAPTRSVARGPPRSFASASTQTLWERIHNHP